MTDRLYIAHPHDGEAKPRLIRAANAAQAHRYLTRSTWAVTTPSTVQVAELVAGGTAVETARDADEQEVDHA